MQKTGKKLLKLSVLCCLFSNIGFSQSKTGLENYNQLNSGQELIWMPVGHYQSEKGIYAEFRYNYEEIKTFSLFGGKNFSGGNKLVYSLTPMAGYSFGTFNGLSAAANTDLEWKSLYFSAQSQYSFSTEDSTADFFFSWSEAGVSITKMMYAGVAMQFTRQEGKTVAETGFVAGLILGRLTIPVYVFNPFGNRRNFVFGLNYEMNVKRKR